jgi:murein DD-endopeptidase MepM/ murein hydrolase activator NlpD
MTVQRFGNPVPPLRETLIVCCLSALMFGSPAAGQQAATHSQPVAAPEIEVTSPRISPVEVDWDAARAALAGLDQITTHDDTAGAGSPDTLARLNVATDKIFPKIAASPVPVLLPFDTAAYLHDAELGSPSDTGKYLSGLQPATFFFTGLSGYDAVFSLRPQDGNGLDLTFANRIDVQISGSALLYQLDAPALSEESPVKELANDFPGIRRLFLEEHLRYAFTRFGVPYVVSIGCFEGANSAHRLSCRDADKVALHVIKALNIVGGAPQTAAATAVPPTIERPAGLAPDFTYYAPGNILPGTGMKGQRGRADTTIYAKIRFPMDQAPAYANSQSFMNWGDCDQTGRVSLGGDGKTAAYRCLVNSLPLVYDESKNYAYPWRDNFCEHRDFYVGQCPAGLGHQGQDIRPGACLLRGDGADRCEPYQQDIVAVRDGILMRAPGDKALYLVVDGPGEHIRFRYLHMDPNMLDAVGMISGRQVGEGEVIGAVDNYGRRQGGTTYHLHFDMQVLTRDGWVFVNPYMTLVTAYERLIGGRGQVVGDAPVATASVGTPAPENQAGTSVIASAAPGLPNPGAMSAPNPDETTKLVLPNAIVAPPKSESPSEPEIVSAEHCKTYFAKGHRRRFCESDRAERRQRARHAHAVRSVDRSVSREGDGARYHRGDLHTRHARDKSRHDRA